MKNATRLLLAIAAVLVGLTALAGNKNVWTGFVDCSGTAAQLPSSSTTALTGGWWAQNYTTKSVWLGTSNTVNAYSADGRYQVLLSNGGVFTSTVVNPNKYWCITAGSTVRVPVYGEYGISN